MSTFSYDKKKNNASTPYTLSVITRAYLFLYVGFSSSTGDSVGVFVDSLTLPVESFIQINPKLTVLNEDYIPKYDFRYQLITIYQSFWLKRFLNFDYVTVQFSRYLQRINLDIQCTYSNKVVPSWDDRAICILKYLLSWTYCLLFPTRH